MTVGIVVVSHSRALAEAACELARRMLPGRQFRLAVAAGLEGDGFGTDAVRIADALRLVDSPSGVVVLMDLGSAVPSVGSALDLLDDDARGRVTLCAAPLVEGLLAASHAAAGGASRFEVAAEGSGALAVKQARLAAAPAGELAAELVAELVGEFEVTAEHGLHARPAAVLVHRVRALDARVLLSNLSTGGDPVPAGSLSKVATLGARRGHRVRVQASGPQARQALEQVLALAASGFDELPAPAAPAGPTDAPAMAALAASPGIAVGPSWSFRPATPDAALEAASGDPAGQRQRLRAALEAAARDVQRVRDRIAGEVGGTEAAIFDAHLALLQDPDLLERVRGRIDAGDGAAAAWEAAIGRVEAELAALPEEYLRARAADARAVGDAVLGRLLGVREAASDGEGVLIAADLTPAQAAGLDAGRVAGIVLAGSSPTAHTAILARARGIPAVVAAGAGVLDLPDGTTVALDGGSGQLVLAPDHAVLEGFRQRARQQRAGRQRAPARVAGEALTGDGVRVPVGANLGSLDDARAAAAEGADLAGLVRTELLFLGRRAAPGVEEQESTYLALAEALGGRRLTLRTLDSGADKPLPYVPMPAEANPFLGVRGLRLGLARPELLREQLLAIVRVARQTPVSVMFPMVSTLEELLAARQLLAAAVRSEGRGEPAGMQVGIMVEVPATALKAAAFAPHVDFFSVGTNDLTQYAMAAERGNGAVARLADPLDPGVLRLIEAVSRGAGERATVGVCGELAAQEAAVAVLLGLGMRELSVAPQAVPGIKQAVRAVSLPEAVALAGRAVRQPGARQVRAMLDPGR
jgi:phosphoenolpyruvate-protein phosphotransferase/dihydroxyacetone kinase phosphotransfer subunit